MIKTLELVQWIEGHESKEHRFTLTIVGGTFKQNFLFILLNRVPDPGSNRVSLRDITFVVGPGLEPQDLSHSEGRRQRSKFRSMTSKTDTQEPVVKLENLTPKVETFYLDY